MARFTKLDRVKKYEESKKLFIVTAREKFETGGTDTYMNHLYYVADAMGYEPILVKVHKSTETFFRKVKHMVAPYQNMSISELARYASVGNPVIVCTVNSKQTSDMRYRLVTLLFKKYPSTFLVVHCPNHVRDFTRDFDFTTFAGKVIAVGKGVQHLAGTNSVYIPHPYNPSHYTDRPKTKLAVCTSLIMNCKHIDMIMEANRLLPDACKVSLHGRADRIYLYHTLRVKYPEIAEALPYQSHNDPASGFEICKPAVLCVNLTTVKFDGGRTEYSTLEAWNAGAVPVIHRDWVEKKIDKVMIPFDGNNHHEANCLAVSDGQELAAVLEDIYRMYQVNNNELTKALVTNGRRVMEERRPEVIKEQFEKLL